MGKSLRVEIIGDPSSYSRALGVATKQTQSFGASLGRLGKTAGLLAGGAAIGGLAITLKRGFGELAEGQKVSAQTAAVLKSTGRVANVSAKQVSGLATSISNMSGIDDEAVQTGENMLLTFQHIRNESGKGRDIFNQATKAIVDMDVAMTHGHSTAESLAKSSILVGKALDDPITGMTALSRVGAINKKDAAELKKAWGDNTPLWRMQADLLGVLNKQFEGSAKAMGQTLPGQLNILKNNFDNLAGSLAQKMLPAINNVLKWVNDHWPEISATFNAVFSAIGTVIHSVLIPAVQAIIPVVQSIVAWFQANWPKISEIAVNVFNKIAPIVMGVFNTVKSIIMGAVTVIQALWERFGGIIISQTQNVWMLVSHTVQNFMNVIRGIVNVIGGLLHGDFGRVWQGIKQIFGAQIDQIKTLFSFGFKSLVNIAKAEMQALLGVISAVAGTVVGAATKIGTGIVSGISSGLSGLFAAVKGGLDKIWGIITNVAHLVYGAAKAIGAEIVHGIVDGIKSLASTVGGALKGAAEKALHYADPRNLKPWSPVSHWAVLLGHEMVKELRSFEAILGDSLTKSLTKALQKAGDTAKVVGVKGMGSAAGAIIAAAKKFGIDVRAALAVAMTEGGTSFFGPIGDKGTSFGPFQMHLGGALPAGMDPAAANKYANSVQGITAALRGMAAAGAAGKAGLAAITAIVANWERPANVAAEIQKAVGYYKQIPVQLGASLEEAGTKTAASAMRTIIAIGAIVRTGAKSIGLEHARNVVAGMDLGAPNIVAKAREAMQAAVAAARQAWIDAKSSFVSAFSSLANDALSAFDEKVSKWVPPAQKILDKMQLEDQINSAVDAVAQAQAAVDKAVADQAALTPQEGESPEDFAARQAAAQQAVVDAVKQLGQAQRAEQELQLQLTAAQQQKAHDERMAVQREQLAKELARIEAYLAEHPKAWAKAHQDILDLFKKFEIPMFQAGQRYASKFASGLKDGIAAVAKAARELAEALDKYVPKSPAKVGPLSYDVFDVGKRWAQQFGAGLAAGGFPNIGAISGASSPAYAGASVGSRGAPINITVMGNVVSERQLIEAVHEGLLQKQRWNSTLGLNK